VLGRETKEGLVLPFDLGGRGGEGGIGCVGGI
jgi:hypothetical protein